MTGVNLVLRSLPGSVLQQIIPKLRSKSFLAGSVLYASNDRIPHLHFVRTEAISLGSELCDGQRVETAMIGRDGIVGGSAVLNDREAICKAIVQVEGDALVLEMGIARELAKESYEFREAIARHEQLILAQAQQSAACNAAHNLSQRLARWFLRVSDATGSDSFKITQDLMAEMLGVGRTSVSIIAHGLQQNRLISYRRGSVRIENRPGLEHLTCECYHTVKLRYEQTQPAPQNVGAVETAAGKQAALPITR